MDAQISVAYFSMEIGVEATIPTYAGGLGILAGDTLRSAADMGIGMAAVSLLPRKGYFHRVLPFQMDRIEALNPRLKAARKLLDAGTVRVTENGAEVDSDSVTHRIWRQDDYWRCTCPWHAKNGTQRGPCKHVLADEMYLENRQ